MIYKTTYIKLKIEKHQPNKIEHVAELICCSRVSNSYSAYVLREYSYFCTNNSFPLLDILWETVYQMLNH